MQIDKSMTIDLLSANVHEVFTVQEGDSNGVRLKLTFMANGNTISLKNIKATYSATIANVLAEEDATATVDGSVVYVPITARMTSRSGLLEIQLKLSETVEGAEEVKYSAKINVNVARNVINGKTIVDFKDFTIYGLIDNCVKKSLTLAGLDLTTDRSAEDFQNALKVYPMVECQGPPTGSTKGNVGQLGWDNANLRAYLCTQILSNVYTWHELVLATMKIAGFDLSADITVEQLQTALKAYPFKIFSSAPTTSDVGKVGQFGGVLTYSPTSKSYSVDLYLCCSVDTANGVYNWALINSNTISDAQIATAIEAYFEKNPLPDSASAGSWIGTETEYKNNLSNGTILPDTLCFITDEYTPPEQTGIQQSGNILTVFSGVKVTQSGNELMLGA